MTAPTGVDAGPGPVNPSTPRRRRRSRLALWSGLSVLVVFSVLIALLATVGSAQDNSPLLGHPAPVTAGPLLSTGRPTSLRDDAGKWVLVNFAASWCEPCQTEMPQLEAFDKAAPRLDATILTVTYDPGDAAGLRSMLASDHATWPAVHDSEVQVQWGLQKGIPQSFLVDPAGVVVAFWASEVAASSIEATIAHLSVQTAVSIGS